MCAWAAVVLDSGQAVAARPTQFDLLEAWLDGPDLIEHAREALACLATDEWEPVAARFGITVDDIHHFFADWIAGEDGRFRHDDYTRFMDGFKAALNKVVESGRPLRLVPTVGEFLSVTSEVTDDAVVVLVTAPVQMKRS